MKTTAYTEGFTDSRIMTGDETFRIKGHAVSREKIKQIVKACKGLKLNWDCYEKAIIAKRLVGSGDVVVGEIQVFAPDKSSAYAHYFNPPFEFHAWLQLGKNIIDVSLPGVIENGLTLKDQYGPCLFGRSPFILAGRPPWWTEYKIKQRIEI